MRRFLILCSCALVACGGGQSGTSDGGVDATPQDGGLDGFVWPDVLIPDAAVPVCGNGNQEAGETCDDGNTVSGDGCNSTCTISDRWDLVANDQTVGDQSEPALACIDTRVVLAFTDWSGIDGDGAGVRIRLFDPDGQAAPNATGGDAELAANSLVGGHQTQPRVAIRDDGSFVVVWKDQSGDTGFPPDVRGRVFAPDGAISVPEFPLTSAHEGSQETPDVATAPDGTWLAVWVDDNPAGPDLSGFGIKGRLFDFAGSPLTNAQTGDTGAFQINQIHAGTQMQPTVVWLGTAFLVVWADASGQLDGSGFGIVATLVDTGGNFVGGGTDYLVNSTTSGHQAAPRVAVQAGAGGLVIWNDDSRAADPEFHGIRGRLIDVNGLARLNGLTQDDLDFQINTVFTAGQQLPAGISSPAGNLAVVWHDWSALDGSGAGIRARQLSQSAVPVSSNLAPVGEDFDVNTTWVGAQLSPVICATGGWFFAAWEDQSAESGDQDGAAVRYRLLPGID